MEHTFGQAFRFHLKKDEGPQIQHELLRAALTIRPIFMNIFLPFIHTILYLFW